MRRVIVSTRAASDVERLDEWLRAKGADKAADRLDRLLVKYIDSRAEMAERGRQLDGGLREIVAPFGRSAYLIQYEVRPETVVIGRILHRLERR